ncbi:KTSC domain-containing protein [Pedobacter agri]|uniref:KTSC domain-containing protein n=1 Tax=Pedobacter agri TaxID=454586 RepID=A0A9X3DCH9_9SPHI|nr:KTSC domain-containing protein [Pedobacter agri]MCX3264787.1 KTSC domain-containing protein [Pedobacter agri]
MKTLIINNQEFTVSEKLEGFTIESKPSSNVAFYGMNSETKELFVQFKNGSAYIYRGITNEAAIGLINAESVGKYISRWICGQFLSTKMEGQMIYQNPLQAVNATDFGSKND